MNELSASLRNQAAKLFDEFLAGCTEAEVHEFVERRTGIAFNVPNPYLEPLQHMTIESAYEHLQGLAPAELTRLLAPPTLPKPTNKPTKKPGKVDHILRTIFGRTYTPPPPPPKPPRQAKPKASAPRKNPATKAVKIVCQPETVIRDLQAMQSGADGEAHLDQLKLKSAELKAIAELLQIPLRKSPNKLELTNAILKFTITGRTDHAFYQGH